MYEYLSRMYDRFMADAPYDLWIKLIDRLWAEQGFSPHGKLVLELGCGTGNMTLRLRERGCDMIALDISQNMLAVAAEKTAEYQESKEGKPEVLYICQDMREFELYGTVDGILCLCDGINYLTKIKDIRKVFKLVKNYLNPGGVFIFDIITLRKYKYILSDNCFSGIYDDCVYIWQNSYDKKTAINEYSLHFFTKCDDGMYTRFDEVHYQRAYKVGIISNLLFEAGLRLIGIYDESGEPASKSSERVFFLATLQ